MTVEITVVGGSADVSMASAVTDVSESGGIVTVDISDPVITVNFSTIEVTVDIGAGVDIILPLFVPFSSQFMYSFDLQQTLNAPLNKSLPEFNTTRF